MIKVGSFTAAGTPAAVELELGFVPDYLRLVNEGATAGNISTIEWFGDDAKALKETVIVDNGSTTNKSQEWITSGGPSALNANELSPLVWAVSTAYEVGDVIRPATPNGYYYVCKTAGTSHTSAPTWLTVVGEDTTETSGVVWTCLDMGDEQAAVRIHSKVGVSIPAALQIASTKMHYIAIRGE